MKNILYIIGLCFLTISCQEVYNVDDLDADKTIPVIQGMITNGDEPTTIKVAYAQTFGETVNRAINDAEVVIFDNQGNKAKLVGDAYGVYQVSKADFPSVPGRIYSVSVKLKTGDLFISDSVAMPMPPVLDSIYGRPSTNNKLIPNTDGEEKLVQYPALELMCALSTSDKDRMYNRFVVKAISQKLSSRVSSQRNPFPYNIYDWTSSSLLETDANQVASNMVNGMQVVNSKHIGYLNYETIAKTDTTTDIVSYGWIVTAYVYRTSAQAFDYYSKIEKQLSAQNHFFDPVPSQITGNFKCVNNPEKLVLGFFEANSQIKKYMAFYWVPLMKSYVKKELSNFVDTVQNGRQTHQAPGFWVNF